MNFLICAIPRPRASAFGKWWNPQCIFLGSATEWEGKNQCWWV